MLDFSLHERLKADTLFVADLKLCRVLLMNDQRYAWIILVPRKEGLREIHNLSPQDQHLLTDETSQLAKILEHEFKAGKMNIAALGNMVPQLHIHVIARNVGDTAWPGPVWGVGDALTYDESNASERIQRIKARL